ncbi:hypothetical protein F0P96_03005 [Hymenobacter busanensis]|uniref:Uncharacterized protein n=1 Tax=Hymenobacter busanensis TaxID=2607656 RepID=A0A7L4ZTE8_9BACT|nr:hypothetical protein [Hymenobacter busanensis]KAA9339596.1 hypothetical protein F0P96_03005 [Hymenobacter busanensis]QHJ06649.1 hypothetical protein GUY19_04750 [Hymenobacter busanensis]
MARLPFRSVVFLPLAILQALVVAYVLRSVSRYTGLSLLLPPWLGEAVHQTVLLCAYLAALLFEKPHPTRRTALLAAVPPALVVGYDVYMMLTNSWLWAVSAGPAAVFGSGIYVLLSEDAKLIASNRAGRWHRLTARRRTP